MDNVVCCYNNFLIFENIRFIDDSPRARYIQSKEAFIELIGKYVVVPQIKRNSILHIIRDCFCDVSMNNSRLFDADSALYFI